MQWTLCAGRRIWLRAAVMRMGLHRASVRIFFEELFNTVQCFSLRTTPRSRRGGRSAAENEERLPFSAAGRGYGRRSVYSVYLRPCQHNRPAGSGEYTALGAVRDGVSGYGRMVAILEYVRPLNLNQIWFYAPYESLPVKDQETVRPPIFRFDRRCRDKEHPLSLRN